MPGAVPKIAVRLLSRPTVLAVVLGGGWWWVVVGGGIALGGMQGKD